MITIDELKQTFDYNPETGNLIWKIPGARRRKVGEIAGCKTNEGRILIGIHRRIYKAHRIIWAIQTGEWPQNHIDHINGNPSDNRWANLREATNSQNMQNVGKIKSNTSGYRGVGWHKKAQKWRAYININQKTHHLGLFNTKEEAKTAYEEARKKFHGEFARHQ